MRPGLRVTAPGLLSTIQDLGRPGYRKLGIPTGGALDPVALRAAKPVIEMGDVQPPAKLRRERRQRVQQRHRIRPA